MLRHAPGSLTVRFRAVQNSFAGKWTIDPGTEGYKPDPVFNMSHVFMMHSMDQHRVAALVVDIRKMIGVDTKDTITAQDVETVFVLKNQQPFSVDATLADHNMKKSDSPDFSAFRLGAHLYGFRK